MFQGVVVNGPFYNMADFDSLQKLVYLGPSRVFIICHAWHTVVYVHSVNNSDNLRRMLGPLLCSCRGSGDV